MVNCHKSIRLASLLPREKKHRVVSMPELCRSNENQGFLRRQNIVGEKGKGVNKLVSNPALGSHIVCI